MSESLIPLSRISSEEVRFKSRTIIFRAGEAARYIYRVEEGRVVLKRYTRGGNSVVTSDAPPGSWVAEASVFEPAYRCDAVAVADSILLRVRHEDIREALRTDSTFMERYMEYLSCQVRRLREQLEIRSIGSADERILQFIRAGARNGVLTVPGSYKNFADQVGLTPEALYRNLRKLEDDGFIARTDKEITVL